MYGNNTTAGMSNEHMTDTNLATRHEETMSQLGKTVAQAEDLLRALGDESGEAIDAMRIRVSSTLRDAKTRLAGRAEQAKTVANNTMTQADRYVHENPWRAVAIGAGIGVVVAMLLSSRRNHRSSGTNGIADFT